MNLQMAPCKWRVQRRLVVLNVNSSTMICLFVILAKKLAVVIVNALANDPETCQPQSWRQCILHQGLCDILPILRQVVGIFADANNETADTSEEKQEKANDESRQHKEVCEEGHSVRPLVHIQSVKGLVILVAFRFVARLLI